MTPSDQSQNSSDRRDGEHINDFRGLEMPLSGAGYGLLPGAARGASTAGRLGG
jgi:hypothetical protein